MNEPMRKHTSIGIGGRALYFVEVNSVEELRTVMEWADSEECAVYILGAGTNILVSDTGIDGIAVKLCGTEFNFVSTEGHVVIAGAACSLHTLVRAAVSGGIGGLECMTGIPGSVGGALIMNAGSSHGTISDYLEEATVLNNEYKVQAIPKEKLRFSYRSSSFEQGDTILSARFSCSKTPVSELTEKKDIIYTEKSETQPLGERSCGCVFKNPPGRTAGEMIDSLGFKGKHVGDIEVSPLHANYLVNKGKGSSRDMVSLMDRIYSEVKESFGITLEPEITFWGDCGWTH